MQWPRQDFFGGDAPATYRLSHTRPPRSGSGGEGPPEGSEVSFFQTMQSIRKLIHFSKISTFFLQKNPFFLRKIWKIEHILQEFLRFLENLFKNFEFFWRDPLDPKKFTMNPNIELRNLFKKAQK